MTLTGLISRLKYYWYHKYIFNITNTKFDISYLVFCQSHLHDQYGIRQFLDEIGSAEKLLFVDIGRNHGLVFYYTLYHIMRVGFPVREIEYYGIEPAPLKFVYFNFHKFLMQAGIRVNYHIIDRAVVFDGETHVALRYGESNFGNFNVSGSKYWLANEHKQSQFECVELDVETIAFSEVMQIIADNRDCNPVIVKIDCKNRTDYIFSEVVKELSKRSVHYLVSCERDGSIDGDMSAYIKPGYNVLTAKHAQCQQA